MHVDNSSQYIHTLYECVQFVYFSDKLIMCGEIRALQKYVSAFKRQKFSVGNIRFFIKPPNGLKKLRS